MSDGERMSDGWGEEGHGALAAPIATIDPLQLAWTELSDLGNAERLVARFGGRLTFVHEWGWQAYDGKCWSAEDGRRRASLAAHEVARAMRGEIAALMAIPDAELEARLGAWCTTEVRKTRVVELRKHSVVSGNASRTAAMLAQAEHLLARHRDEFDRDPLCINAQNGTLRIRKDRDGRWGVMRDPHDPADMLTRITACDYDPAAECRNWRRHLETVLPDPEVRGYFQEVMGYSLSGLRTEQMMLMVQGKGGDGKSTAMDMFLEMIGTYGVAADVQTFIAGPQRSAADASPDLARLAGDTRFVLTSEPKRGQAIDEGRVKQFTGGGRITARKLNGDPFEYVPHGLLVMECNSRPRISGDDDGIWRRISIVLFPHQFKGDAINKRIKDDLRPELSGILNWALEGLLRWLARGRLAPPQAVAEAIEDYRRAANPFGEWFAERVDTSDPVALVLAAVLFDDYKAWCERNGAGDREVMNSTAFGRALGDRQILKGPKDRTGKIQRRGAKLRPEGYSSEDLWRDDDE